MALDPEMAEWLRLAAAQQAGAPAFDPYALPPVEAARAMRAGARPPAPRAADPDVSVSDVMIACPQGEVPLRIYHPRAPRGVMLNIHGGGWVLGSIEADHDRCLILQRVTGATVVSVGYRRAPEHPFPAPLDDCCAAMRWAWRERASLAAVNAGLVVEGSSAGANLAAATALVARDEGVEVALQVLISPVCDCDFETASYRDNAEGYFLTRAMMRWFWDQYAPGDLRNEALVSVSRHPKLSGAAPALIIAAEFDPLRDDARAYGERLRAAGVAVEIQVVPGALHSFTSLAPASALARAGFELIGRQTRRALGAGA